MRRRALLSAMIALSGLTNACGIDLTPMPKEYRAEGITFRQLLFKDGKRQVIYEPPRQWSYQGIAGSLQLAPANANHAKAVIEALPLPSPQTFDDKTIKALKEQFVSSLPPGSQGVELISEELGPVALERGVSYAITGSYQVIGETFVRSVVLVNLPDTQLSFRFTARKTDFDALHRQFRSSILSWHWVDRPNAVASGPLMTSP